MYCIKDCFLQIIQILDFRLKSDNKMFKKRSNIEATSLQAFYFQLIPIYLSIVGKQSILPSQTTTYKFVIFKRHLKFDETKSPLYANFKQVNGIPTMSVGSVKLNFCIPNYNKMRKQQFTLRLYQTQPQSKDIYLGQYIINPTTFIESFKQKNLRRYQLKTFFSEDYQLAFQLFIEKSKILLEQCIKQQRNEDDEIRECQMKIVINDLESKSSQVEHYSILRNDKVKPTKDKDSEQIQERQIRLFQRQRNHEKVNERPTKDTDLPKILVNMVPIEEKQLENYELQRIDEETELSSPQKQHLKNPKFITQVNLTTNRQEQTGIKLSKIPLIQTKFKQLANSTAELQTQMRQSFKDREGIIQQTPTGKVDSDQNAKYIMWFLMFIGIILLYFTMHPVIKV